MPTRAEKIAFIQSQQSATQPDAGPSGDAQPVNDGGPKTRAEKIAFIQAQQAKPKAPDSPGILSQAGDLAVDAGKGAVGLLAAAGHKLDSVTGAPVRAMIGAAQDGKADPFGAAVHQFGRDPSEAPTGKQIVMKAGLDDTKHLSDVLPGLYMDRNKGTSFWDPRIQKGGMLDPSAADAGGLAMNIATDPLTYIPGGMLAKGGEALATSNLGSKVAGGLAQAGAKAGSTLDRLGPIASGYGGGLVAEALGVPKHVGHVVGMAITSPEVRSIAGNTAGRVATQASQGANYAEPVGLGLDQLGHQGEPGLPNVTPGPLKGPDKWVNDGLSKVAVQDPDTADLLNKQDLVSDPKIKDLLIQASDLKPGTKAMEIMLAKIKARANK